MSYDIERAGWVWIDVREPDKLDRTKVHRIEIGREFWGMRYAGLNDWYCYRNVGDVEVPANPLIEAGCPVFVRREPLKWESTARVAVFDGNVMLEELQGTLPTAFIDAVVKVIFIEVPQTDGTYDAPPAPAVGFRPTGRSDPFPDRD